jgi:hypothetical protein
VARGTIDVVPEVAALADAYLPRGVTIASQQPYGGAIRMEIQGQDLDDGKAYQLVVTDEPFKRVIELKLSPYQDA